MLKFLIINGPNLNQLGRRQSDIYGNKSLSDLEESIRDHLKGKGCELDFFQSNHEGEIIDKIHSTSKEDTRIIINAGAFTHSSVAIRDAFLSVMTPFIEVHISNVFAREEFRHHSYLCDIAQGVICGLGFKGYICAIDYFLEET